MRRLLLWLFLLVFLTPSLAASPLSELRGILKDQEGNPVVNVALSLIREGMRHSARSDSLGRFILKNLPAGQYAIELAPSNFKPAEILEVRLKPGERAFLTLVLQQVFSLDPTGPVPKNYETRTILRNNADGRLIFRNAPEVQAAGSEGFGQSRSNGVVQVYSALGSGTGNFSSLPPSPNAGMLTNFGYAESVSDRLSYVVAGQFVSGDDSLWKARNFLRYELGAGQQMELVLGYTRLSSDSPRAFPGEMTPARIARHSAANSGGESAKTLALGVRHSWSPVEGIRLNYGASIDRFTSGSSTTSVNPSVEASWRPHSGPTLDARVLNKRLTRDDSFLLPDGTLVEVADSLRLTRIGDALRAGSDRRYELSGAQQFGRLRGELSVFHDRLRGGTPFMILSPGRKAASMHDIQSERLVQQGIRAVVGGGSEGLNYDVSYVYGSGVPAEEVVAATGPSGSMQRSVRTHYYHAVSGRVQGRIPRTHTVVTGVIRVVPNKPVTTIDLFNDTWNVANQSFNLFLRQVIPFPEMLGFAPRLEALVDLRNLLNQDAGIVHTEAGDLVLVRNPRAVRGGISLNF